MMQNAVMNLLNTVTAPLENYDQVITLTTVVEKYVQQTEGSVL